MTSKKLYFDNPMQTEFTAEVIETTRDELGFGVILSETDLYADEQIGRIAREMGFAEELSAVLDRLGR